jgi:hypothetical protein
LFVKPNDDRLNTGSKIDIYDFLLSITKMNIGKFFSQRTVQMQQEVEIDNQLKSLQCQEDVNRILFFLRQVNRRQMIDMSSTIPSYNIPALWSALNINLDEIDNCQKILQAVLLSDSPCYHIKYIFNKP